MNLINCSKNCIYQKDGYCNVNGNMFINSVNNSDCCYYKSKKAPPYIPEGDNKIIPMVLNKVEHNHI